MTGYVIFALLIALMLVMGVVIGGIVVLMYLPIFQLGAAPGGQRIGLSAHTTTRYGSTRSASRARTRNTGTPITLSRISTKNTWVPWRLLKLS